MRQECGTAVGKWAGSRHDTTLHRLAPKSTLRDVGFVNLAEERWHYTFTPEPHPDACFGFPVSAASLVGRR